MAVCNVCGRPGSPPLPDWLGGIVVAVYPSLYVVKSNLLGPVVPQHVTRVHPGVSVEGVLLRQGGGESLLGLEIHGPLTVELALLNILFLLHLLE